MRKVLGVLAVLGAVGWAWLCGPGDVVPATVCVGNVNCQEIN
ncbi:hypothetical protein [Streptomyces telluris]|uniref:Uncharacterized protein n=1 Tax=Streptomyces telluris TaxID=2720021 RepID=A0A9X2RP78_9ACTN|nr:hypothetical protein [Streptomyces telluris]MCQ8773608.1 hypothetical protein [Streptomyces telluris]